MTADDVAAQLARERALKQADKMETIGRLTGAIAQQFNELLGAILARTAALAQGLPPNRDLDALKETAQRGAELVQRLLGFSRHRVLDLQPLILTEFVRDALDIMRRGLPANIEMQFEADEESGVVEAHPAAVNQVLLHLGTNAHDARPKRGTLQAERRQATKACPAGRKRSCWWRTIKPCAWLRSSSCRRSATGSSPPSTASRDWTPSAPTARSFSS